ncbi:SusC/RagA family TonB-linked outer membrane protein [Elizabethkingia anophelis]|nr:SusC/RagA family TonB-linked outer membrane protein [Elizabethkingia anophelis]MCT3813660.1 SusC/RagA family TonB-linked outer membrane protein [Elizabethkingia anophelis]MCT3820754.1 SusC/RagA family TonB-linked outer membrane protein [Elizabethkingia anophelis]
MKKILIFPSMLLGIAIMAQQQVTGIVLDETTSYPVSGISVSLPDSKAVTVTDAEGRFSLKVPTMKTRLNLFGKNYENKTMLVEFPEGKPLIIYLKNKETGKINEIEAVNISTGYQRIPKERATGSFSTVDNKLLQQQVTTNILDRLPAVANGLSMTKGITEDGQLMVRGLSTLQGSKSPLIVVDNFPYEGDIKNINPNMVESVTVLKDAAASSIWGARAANGVIVITTKGAKFNQSMSVDFTANLTLSAKPDLGYTKQMSSSDFIDVEMELFKRGYYNSDLSSPSHPVLTPVVDLLNKEQKGLISSADMLAQIGRLRSIDVRDQYKKYMYLPLENRQYALNISAGAPNFSWTSFFGYDDNSGNLGEKYQRFNARFQNTWKPFSGLSVTTGVYFTNAQTQSGRSAYNSINMYGVWKVPYMEFADAKGQPLVVNSLYDQNYKNSLQGKGLLDWNYYPLTDWQHRTVKNDNTEILLNAAVNYKILKGLDIDVKYQYQRLSGLNTNLNDDESYYARNMINSFARSNADGSVGFIIPKGGIMIKSNTLATVNNLRGQINYNNTWLKHNISAIAGGEMRETSTRYESNQYYGYNSRNQSVGVVDYTNQYPNYVTGNMDFIPKVMSLRETNIRFLSLYANAAYTYDKKYTISGSVRRDASNLFGLKTNDQWNPFWSAGLAWNISNENFYHVDWLPNLKLRGSYGFNGNIDPAMVAVTTIAFDSNVSVYTGGRTARIDQYYNPNLKWEMIKIINMGLDFATKNNRITGSVEYFQKEGNNLFGEAPLDYTTGIKSMLWNVAGMKGNGIDVELRTRNIDKAFKWNSILNFSTYKDQVTDYYLSTMFASNFVSRSGSQVPISGITGLPVFSIFAYKWAGLDPVTGDPQGYVEGKVSKDYSQITSSEKGVEDLRYFGSAVPTKYGSFINNFSYGQLSLDVAITYKFGYWFRRSSISYTDLIMNRDGHSDYSGRWQKPGDELNTNVPSNRYESNSARDAFYLGSEALVEKGDHIRLQYINLNYSFSKEVLQTLKLKNLQLYCNINNIGILWRANKQGIDPDYNWGTYSLKPVTTYSLGLRVQF